MDAVPIPFAVGFVVFLVVRHQIIEGKAIVSGDKIDAVDRQFSTGLEDVGASCQDISDFPNNCFAIDVALVALDKTPNGIAVTSVPFPPTITGEEADLIETGGIPSLSNDFGIDQDVRQFNLPDDWWIDHRQPMFVATQNDRLIKAEAANVHFCHPVLQDIDNKLFRTGMIAVDGVAATRIVHIVLLVMM